jgi:hypothetical protein
MSVIGQLDDSPFGMIHQKSFYSEQISFNDFVLAPDLRVRLPQRPNLRASIDDPVGAGSTVQYQVYQGDPAGCFHVIDGRAGG